MKKSLDGINNKLDAGERKISEVEDKLKLQNKERVGGGGKKD